MVVILPTTGTHHAGTCALPASLHMNNNVMFMCKIFVETHISMTCLICTVSTKKRVHYQNICGFFKYAEIHDTYIMFFQALRIALPIFFNVQKINS
jgi:hypothetical protein